MKKIMALLTALACLSGTAIPAAAEKGFEKIYGYYCDEQVFGQPWQVYDMAEGETEKICLAIFMFDPENDMTQAVLIGAEREGVNKYYTWTAGYEDGAVTMSFLLSQFTALKEACEEGVDFCISFTFDGGETMIDIDTAEKAEELTAILQQTAADMEIADSLEAP